MGDVFHYSTTFNDRLNNISNLVMTLQGQINKLTYSSMEMEHRCADLRVLLQTELEVEKSEELLQEVSDNSKTCIVEDFSDKTAALVFDEMPHYLSNVFATPQIGQKLDKLKSGLDENKTEEADFMTTNLDKRPFVIVTGDTKSEIQRHEALSIVSIYTHLEKSGVASSPFDEILEIDGAYRYSLIPENDVAQHVLLQFPFDRGSCGLVFDNVALVFDNSPQFPISTNEFRENPMVPIAVQVFDTVSQPCDCSKDKVFVENPQGDATDMLYLFNFARSAGITIIDSYFLPPIFEGVTLVLDRSLPWCLSFNALHAIATMEFGENPVATIVDSSLVCAMESEDAFNLPLFIFRAFDPSTLVYHCIPKSKAMALIFPASNANANAFTTLLVVEYAVLQVKLEGNFAMNVAHKIPDFLWMNPIEPVLLLGTLDSHVFERNVIACYGTLWHHQSVMTCLHNESHIALAENVGLCMDRNCSNFYETLIDLNLEHLRDTHMHQLCSILEAPFTGLQLVPAIPLLLIHNYTCISLARAVHSFLREELKFSNHLIAQVHGSQLAEVVFAKRINTHDMLMTLFGYLLTKLVTAFKELVRVWCDSLQVNWFGFFYLDLIIHNMVIGVYVLRGWLNHKKRFFRALIAHEIIAAFARTLIVEDFAVHTFENDSWSLSMIESDISFFATEDKLVLPCMLSLGFARHSHELGTRFNMNSYAFMLHFFSNKSSFFPTDEFDFFLIVIIPIVLGFPNSKASSSICWISWFSFQPTIISASFQPFHSAFATEEIAFYTIERDLTDPDASVGYEFCANSDVECGNDYENHQVFVKNFNGAAQALEQNQLTPYSIIWYCPEAFILCAHSKFANATSCQGTVCRSLCEFPIVMALIFVGKGCTQCEALRTLLCGRNLGICWKVI